MRMKISWRSSWKIWRLRHRE